MIRKLIVTVVKLKLTNGHSEILAGVQSNGHNGAAEQPNLNNSNSMDLLGLNSSATITNATSPPKVY